MKPKTIRCAIYTRKSSEEGLDQEFNSLDAQREACAAYILSQRQEGWVLVPDFYDDGGFSGGNMERPGLKQLLADVALGKVDVIVVYKVDRLTRSLADFSKIVEVLEKADASFVSITQAFNTTTSMGRLMLNVLLSFAQFEREVTGERIRDKFAASKRKGMFMGGLVPLGYQLGDRRLLPHDEDAATVRCIFQRYAELGSLKELIRDLNRRGIVTKQRQLRDGRPTGGIPFTKGPLQWLLRNPIYIGEVRHKGERYPGEHPAIIDRSLWEQVQAMLDGKAPRLTSLNRITEPSRLTGMILDGEGRAMTPSHGTKGSRRYRYYITREQNGQSNDSWRVPAADIDTAVLTGLERWLREPDSISRALAEDDTAPELIAAAATLADLLPTKTTAEQHELLRSLGTSVRLSSDRIEVSLDRACLFSEFGMGLLPDQPARVTLSIAASLTRRGNELRLVYPPTDHGAPKRTEPGLVKLIAEAEQAHVLLLEKGSSLDVIKRGHLTRLARLKFLAPEIVSAILDGRQPALLTRLNLIRATSIPLDWQEQRRMLGFT